jgi:hypothetical protein
VFLTLKIKNGVLSTSKVDQPQHFIKGFAFLAHGIQELLGLQKLLLLAQGLQLRESFVIFFGLVSEKCW